MDFIRQLPWLLITAFGLAMCVRSILSIRKLNRERAASKKAHAERMRQIDADHEWNMAQLHLQHGAEMRRIFEKGGRRAPARFYEPPFVKPPELLN